MPGFTIFLWGAFGSVAIEIVRAWRFFNRNHRFPSDYSKWQFWLVRFLLTVVAGSWPVLHHVQTELLAVELGIIAPLLIEEMAMEKYSAR
jgi:hypothetical protein